MDNAEAEKRSVRNNATQTALDVKSRYITNHCSLCIFAMTNYVQTKCKEYDTNKLEKYTVERWAGIAQSV
jgi:hypothetical protein